MPDVLNPEHLWILVDNEFEVIDIICTFLRDKITDVGKEIS